MDRGLWITWYDLPEDGREAYLRWLHATYIPGILRRPGLLWAAHYATVSKEMRVATTREKTMHRTYDPALPTGSQYMLMFGAEHASVFGNPVPSALHAELPQESTKMLAMRLGERVNIMVEAARVEGPEAPGYKGGMALAPCIQLGSYNCAYRKEEEILAWYAQWRMPAMAVLPGVIRTRKLVSVAGWAKHGILYEFTSLEARNRHFVTHEARNPEMKAWSDRVVAMLDHVPGSSALACRIWPA